MTITNEMFLREQNRRIELENYMIKLENKNKLCKNTIKEIKNIILDMFKNFLSRANKYELMKVIDKIDKILKENTKY